MTDTSKSANVGDVISTADSSLDFGMKLLGYFKADADPDMVVVITNSTEMTFELVTNTSKPVHGAWIETPAWKIGPKVEIETEDQGLKADSPISKMTLEGKGKHVETLIVYKVVDKGLKQDDYFVFYVKTSSSDTFHAGFGAFNHSYKDKLHGKGEGVIEHMKSNKHKDKKSKPCEISAGEYISKNYSYDDGKVEYTIRFQPNDVKPHKVLFSIEPKK